MATTSSVRQLMVTRKDMERLTTLMEDFRGDASSRPYFKALKQELTQAKVMEPADIPADVVTMNSTVQIRNVDAKRSQKVTVVYPQDADIDEDKISVLAPLGTALLGYRAGDEVQWEVPAGLRTFRIEKILYQPEAAGDLHL